MIKKRIAEWAINAIVSYVEENGAELAAKVAEWLKALLESSDEKTFASPAPVAGCETFCEKKFDEFLKILDESE